MNKRQLKIANINQKKSNSFHHYYAANSIDGRKLVLTNLKVSKSNLFDILNNSILGTYREVFNAWNQVTSKVFTYLKTVCNRFTLNTRKDKQSPLLLQLIPIDTKQEDVFVEMKRPEEYGNGSI